MKTFQNILCVLLISTTTFTLHSCKDVKDKDPVSTPIIVNWNPGPCDDGLLLDEANPMNYARALGICKESSGGSDWGLINAQFIRANSVAIPVNYQYGIMQNFGSNVTARNGTRMVVMSTGRARTPSESNSCGSASCSGTGAGSGTSIIPFEVTGCLLPGSVNDDVGLLLTLVVPEGATGFAIDYSFYSFDYPELMCSSYNDQFVIIVDPVPPGSLNGHVALDTLSKPIGVNSYLLQTNNNSLLTGTGFDSWSDGASTGWVQTTVPVNAGSTINIKLIIYDLGDGNSDSSVLIDNFIWLEGSVALHTKRI